MTDPHLHAGVVQDLPDIVRVHTVDEVDALVAAVRDSQRFFGVG